MCGGTLLDYSMNKLSSEDGAATMNSRLKGMRAIERMERPAE